jgi:HD-GYP domain-containing protein (c-di-GMP phosphodiesterase class II)
MPGQSSPTSDSQQSRFIQTKPDELKVGMYVDLNCSWFKHPFASKTFKITSENELAIIRGLGLSSVLVDPVLSDGEKGEQRDSDTAKDGKTVSSNASAARPSSNNVPFHPTITRYKESLQQADAVYKQTLAQSAKVLSDIRTGSEAGLMTAKEMVNSLADLVLDDATSSAMGSLLGTQDLEDVSALHAMNVSVLSMLVGRQFDLAPDQMKILGTAGLLHDIGEQQLPPHLLKRGGQMTTEERQAFQQHVEYGLGMIAKFPGLPDGVTEIVQHHHERVDGSGYPSQIKGRRLSLLSRILMVVDEYDCLVNAPDIHQNITPTEALSKLYLTGKTAFSEEVVVALIQMLSVYPPGTVVELNDRSIGLVISINLHSRMRPLVILYDPTVDQENPNIANLSRETHRSIVRSVTKSELSQEAADYLNLARWTGYFINSSLEALEEKPAA